jgi:hypothetical protein
VTISSDMTKMSIHDGTGTFNSMKYDNDKKYHIRTILNQNKT